LRPFVCVRSRTRDFLRCVALVSVGAFANLAATPGAADANETAGKSPPAAVAQSSASPAPNTAADISDLRAQMEVMKAKLDLLESEQEQQAKIASDLTTQQADTVAKAKKDSASGVHVGNAGTSVRLYGLIEPTIVNQTNTSKSGVSSTGIPVSWFSGNRWGLDINQKVGSAEGAQSPSRLDLIAKLESEFEFASGNMDTPGVLFNRDAWLGVQSKTFGKLTIGRQDTLPRDVAANWGDPYGTAEITTNEGNFTNVNNFKQLIFYMSGGNGAGGQGDTRYDSAIVWKKLYNSGLFLAAAYNFGDANGPGGPNGSGPIPGAQFNRGSSAALGAGYNLGHFHPNVFYTTTNVLSAKTIGADNLGFQDQSVGFGGNYDWGKYRLNAGYIYYSGDQGALGHRYDKAWTTSGRFAPTKYNDYELGVQEFYAQNAAVNAAGYVLRPFTDFTASTATISGTRFTVYGSVFFHPLPNIDMYLAADDLLTGGGYLDGRANGFKHQVETASGVRYKF
jgi:predicted porin